jgi:hypothetical protein
MSKYVESPANIAAYQRCKQITIYNPFLQPPTVVFHEEQVLKRPDGSVLYDNLGLLTKNITNFYEVFPIYNPTTQVKTGQMANVAQLYAMIWSVYMNEAVHRDAHLAHAAVLAAFEKHDAIDKINMDAAIATIWSEFATNDAVALATAEALAATKSTQAEMDAVMEEYAAARIAAETVERSAAETVRLNYEADRAAGYAQALVEAAAAEAAVIAAG